MRKKSIFKFLLTCWITTTVFSSCNDIDLSNISNDVAINESLIVPAGEATITVDDLLKKAGSQNYISANDGTNEIYFTSEKDIDYSFRKIDLLQFSRNKVVTVKPWSIYSGSVPIPAGTTITDHMNDSVSLGINNFSAKPGERIEKTEINSATIGLNLDLTPDIKSSIKYNNVQIRIEFPNGTMTNQDGSPVDIFVTPSPYGTVKPIVLNNFIMKTPGGATGVPVKVTVTATTSFPATASNTSAFNCTVSFNQISFKTVWGHFLPDASSKDSVRIPLDLPTSLSDFNLKFANPIANITVKSSVGAKLLFNVDYVKAFDKNNVEITKAHFTSPDGDSHTFKIPKPKSTTQTGDTIITLDKDNGSTNLLFATDKIPDVLEYRFSSGVERDLNSLDFILPDSKIQAHVSVKVPMLLNAGSSISLKDTIENIGKNLKSSMKDVNVDSAIIVLDVTNHFPLAATLELVNTVDSLGKPILTDFVKKYSIDAPTLNESDGSVKTPKVTQLQIKLKPGQYDQIRSMKDLYFNITLGDSNSAAMHLVKTDYIKIKMGAYAKGTITSTLGSDN